MTSGNPAQKVDVTLTRRVPLSIIPITPFGKYTLIGKLGHGGMAEVFLAYVAGPAGFRKLVVIKRLHPHLEDEPGFLDMFLDEARLAARLNHPNVVQTYEVGEVDGSHFIAMEYLEGQGLDRLRQRSIREELRIPVPVVANVIIEALEGLHYAHNLKDFDGTPLGVIHRDISPQNVFITYEGSVKLLDFGIAKAATHVVETRTGIIKGKFAYIAPEQARGGKIDHRADIWSMGVVLWETLARRRLFKGPNDVATLSETLTGKIPSLCELDPDVPEALDSVAKKALSRDISARYQTALEMRDDLRGFLVAEAPKTSHEEVSAFIKKLFSDVIDQNRRVLKLCLSDATAEHGISTGELRMLTQTPGGELAVNPSSGSGSITPPSQPSGVVRVPAASHPSLTPISGAEFTPAQQAAIAEQQKQQARFTTVVWISVLLLVIPIAAVTGWLITRGGDDEAQAASDVRHAPPAEKVPSAPQSHVVLTSTPANAEVRLGDTLLGRTPLERDLDQLPLGVNVSFVFSLEGHDDLTVSSPLRGERVDVHADFTKVAPRAQPDAGSALATDTKAPPPEKVRRPPSWWLRDHNRRSPEADEGSAQTAAQQGTTQPAGEGDTRNKAVIIDSPPPRVILDEGKQPTVPIID